MKVKVVFAFCLMSLTITEYLAFDGCFGENFCCQESHCTLENVASWNDAAIDTNNYYFQHYQQNGYFQFIDFVNVKFPAIPAEFFKEFLHLLTLDASSNQLEKIDRETFKEASNLKVLDLSNNKIKSLSTMAFYFLKSLEEIDLSHNQITELKSAVFEDCSKLLFMIDVSNNWLTSIDEEILNILGKSTKVSITFSNNQIKNIEKGSNSNSNRSFSKLDLCNNSLESFDYDFNEVLELNLKSNKLQSISLGNKKITSLDVSDNNITELKVHVVEILDVSNNLFLTSLTFDETSTLKSLKSRVKIGETFQLIKSCAQLEILDLSYSRLGPLRVDDFAELTSLQELRLKKTGISNVNYGTFSHQKNLKVLDISDNSLGSIDLHMLSGLLELTELDISGNNLTKLDLYDSCRANFPQLKAIGLDNNWNCTYLVRMLKSLNLQNIAVKDPVNIVKTSSNVLGIGCSTTDQSPIEKVTAHNDDKIKSKLNEIIEQVNEEKNNRNNYKLDFDILKAENFHLKNEILDVKSQIAKLRLSSTIPTSNSSIGNINEIRIMVDQINNITLEKQRLENEKIMLKLNELELEIEKAKFSNQKYLQKDQIHEILKVTNDHKTEKLQNYNSSTNTHFVEISLAVIITVMVGVALLKIKNYLELQTRIHRRDLGSIATFQTTDGNIDLRN